MPEELDLGDAVLESHPGSVWQGDELSCTIMAEQQRNSCMDPSASG